jgi:YbbR domain-containing protein
VKIRPAIDGRPAPGYAVAGSVVDPPEIEIAGPESAVDHATEALTEPVMVTGAKTTVTQLVTVGVMDPSLRVKSTRAVKVTVNVVPAAVVRELRDLPIHLLNLGPSLAAIADPPVASISLRGTHDALNHITGDDVKVYVDVGGLGAGLYALTVRADAQRDAGVTSIKPETVHVRIASGR